MSRTDVHLPSPGVERTLYLPRSEFSLLRLHRIGNQVLSDSSTTPSCAWRKDFLIYYLIIICILFSQQCSALTILSGSNVQFLWSDIWSAVELQTILVWYNVKYSFFITNVNYSPLLFRLMLLLLLYYILLFSCRTYIFLLTHNIIYYILYCINCKLVYSVWMYNDLVSLDNEIHLKCL